MKESSKLHPLLEDTPVWVSTQGQQVQGTVKYATNTSKSYVVDTPSAQLSRNCSESESDQRTLTPQKQVTVQNIFQTLQLLVLVLELPDGLTYYQS